MQERRYCIDYPIIQKYEGLKIIVVFDAQLVPGVTKAIVNISYKSSLLKKVKLLTAISNASLEN